jgi:hypothetical protein
MNAAMALALPSAGGLLGQYSFFYFAALVVLTAFFGAVIAVPLTRQAFGLREEQVAAHFVVGMRELLLFLALLRYYAIVVTALVVLAVGGGIVISQAVHYASAHGYPSEWQGVPLETWLNSSALTIATILTAVLAVRYGFFLDAIAAVEDRSRLSRASALTRGSFWPVLVILCVVALPAGLVVLSCEMTFGGLSLASVGLAPADATPFAGILAAGLVVLHALSAGASAGAYTELAEAAAHEPIIGTATDLSPAMVYASANVATAEPVAYQAEPAATVEHVAAEATPVESAVPPMEIATPEAPTAIPGGHIATHELENAAAALAGAGDWMAPPPDAHFGSDPHDAQHHAHEDKTEPLAAAFTEAEAAAAAHPVAAQNAEPAQSADIVPELAAEHAAAESDVAGDPDAAQPVGFDGHPVPEHALHAEFPAPPLDPAGVLAAQQQQQGFHSPG